MKKKLSVILATALSVSMLSQSTMAYAAPVSTSYQDVFAKVFEKLDELKTYNEGKVPELFTDWTSDFKFIDGAFTNIKVRDTEDAIESINSIKEIMDIDAPESEFEVLKVNKSNYITSYRLQQLFHSIPVYGRELIVATDKAGNTTSVGGNYLKDLSIDTTATVAKADAVVSALASFENATAGATELTIYTLNDVEPTLCWKVTVSGTKEGKDAYKDVFVNATTGDVVTEVSLKQSAAATGSGKDLSGVTQTFGINKSSSWFRTTYQLYDTARKIKIYKGTGNNIPGSMITSTSTTFNDPAAVSGMVNLAKTYDYYKNVQGRNSYDGNGSVITATVHYKESSYGQGYDNAFWTPQYKQFVFGDGQTYFTPLTGALDVIAHEFTHAVIETICDLEYENQSGALNEAYADIMGQIIEGDDDSQWLLGEDIMKNGDAGLRNMSNPEMFQQPSKVGGTYYVSPTNPTQNNDYGGVHTNSGIINHAAYLMWANGMDKADVADVFYNSLFLMTSTSTFSQCRAAVLSAASNMNMSTSQINIIKNAFTSVGIPS